MPTPDEIPWKLPDPEFRAPDLSQAIEGWRVWRCTWNPRGFEEKNPKLFSATHSKYYWTPRKAGVATCRKNCGSVPGEGCTCGFYSARDFDHLMTLGYHHYDLDRGYGGTREVMVLGQIANWGKVLVGDQGWRAEKAYPIKLWVPFEAAHLAAPLSETYGVPVELKNILAGRQSNIFLPPQRRS